MVARDIKRRMLTSISEECSAGRCADCPGIFEREEHGEEAVFCIHDCHAKKNEFECPACGGATADPKASAFQNLIVGRITCQHCGHEFIASTKPHEA